MKICKACGMPMKTKDDYAAGDENKDFCKYCARSDGSMQSYDEKLKGMTGFIVKTQGLDEKAARDAAKGMMAKLPAWKEKI
ncbi:MAG: zinc ribbon domain-containing protein [Bacillota bacterium]|nr:zinc ribbon domain-containing protein [Bacillota bacterium]